MEQKKILVICGPTATGKTALAIALAKRFGGELVGADSRHLYKGLDILTGKDIPEETKIWMVDLVDMTKSFSVFQYVRLAQRVIRDIWRREKLPIVVGGTGLYIQALVSGLPLIHIPPNPILRNKLNGLSVSELQDALKEENSSKLFTMNVSDLNNPRRLIRAIEIARSLTKGGRKIPQIWQTPEALWIGLRASVGELEKWITRRVYSRWEMAVEEVRKLSKQGVSGHLPAVTSLGVRAVQSYLKGTATREGAQRQWVLAERGYAKRQITWFKKQKHIRWFDVTKRGFEKDVSDEVRIWYTGTHDEN